MRMYTDTLYRFLKKYNFRSRIRSSTLRNQDINTSLVLLEKFEAATARSEKKDIQCTDKTLISFECIFGCFIAFTLLFRKSIL